MSFACIHVRDDDESSTPSSPEPARRTEANSEAVDQELREKFWQWKLDHAAYGSETSIKRMAQKYALDEHALQDLVSSRMVLESDWETWETHVMHMERGIGSRVADCDVETDACLLFLFIQSAGQPFHRFVTKFLKPALETMVVARESSIQNMQEALSLDNKDNHITRRCLSLPKTLAPGNRDDVLPMNVVQQPVRERSRSRTRS